MAQQLATLRTPEAYAGVTAYAHQHTGDAAAAAYLALGHAYLLDKRYAEAETNLRQARQAGEELADYADFLGAEASHEAGDESAAEAVCCTVSPLAILTASSTPGAGAGGKRAAGHGQSSRRARGAGCRCRDQRRQAAPATSWPRGRWSLRWASRKRRSGSSRDLLLGHPLSADADTARARLTNGRGDHVDHAELRSLGDAYTTPGATARRPNSITALARAPGLSRWTATALPWPRPPAN